MAVPSPAETEAAVVRVRLVADMLLQKAQEVRSKGNAGAATSLQESASDLNRSVELMQELTRHVHQPPAGLRRDSVSSASSNGPLSQEGNSSAPVSASAKDLVTKLSRVDALLGKKSDEMKQKGNEGAAHALLQSAHAVRQAVHHIAEQQVMTRTLVVSARALREQLREQCRAVLGDEDVADGTAVDEELTKRAIESAKEIAAIRDMVRSVKPQLSSVEELRDVIVAGLTTKGRSTPPGIRGLEVERVSTELTTLQKHLHEVQLSHARELCEAHEATDKIRDHSEALEKALEELKMGLLAKEEEVHALKTQADRWMNQLTTQQEALAELRDQREQDRHLHDRQVIDLEEQLRARDTKLRESGDELSHLRMHLEEKKETEERNEVTESGHNLGVSAVSAAEERVAAVRGEFESRLKEMARSFEELDAKFLEREKRAAELESELHQREEEADVDKSNSAEKISYLQQNLEQERTERAKVKSQLKHALEALSNKHSEAEEHRRMLAAFTDQSEERVRDLQLALNERSAAADSLKSTVERGTVSIAALSTRLDEMEVMLRTREEELLAKSQQLEEARNDLIRLDQSVQEAQAERKKWSRGLVLVAQDLVGDCLPLQENASFDDVSEALHQHCAQLMDQLKRMRAEYDELLSKREADLAEATGTLEGETQKIQLENEQFQVSLSELKNENALLERRLETLDSVQAQAASIAANAQSGTAEIEALKVQLQNAEAEFSRYRTRSRAALKKIEKRAELLNSMRKENETLSQAMSTVRAERDAAVTRERDAQARLEKGEQAVLMRQEEAEQKVFVLTTQLKELTEELRSLKHSNEDLQAVCDAAMARSTKLQQEKEELAVARRTVHEETLALRATEIQEYKMRLHETEDALNLSRLQIEQLKESVVQRDEQITMHEEEYRNFRQATSIQASVGALVIERDKAELELKIDEVQARVEQKKNEVAVNVVEATDPTAALLACSDLEEAFLFTHLSSGEEIKLRGQLRALEADNHQLTKRIAEIQLLQTTAEDRVERLRNEQAKLDKQIIEHEDDPRAPSSSVLAELSTLKEAHDAREGQVTRLLEEIESVSMRQVEDQRLITDLREKLIESQSLARMREHLRLANGRAGVPANADGMVVQINRGMTLQEMSQARQQRIAELEAADVTTVADPMEKEIEQVVAHNDTDSAALRNSRVKEREEYEHEMEAKHKERVDEYAQTTASVIRELQPSLDEYSSAFRDACAVREDMDQGAAEQAKDGALPSAQRELLTRVERDFTAIPDLPELPQGYEEYLTLNSGVIVKAGSTFSLPVYCDKPGWRVEWKFVVKEDGADINFNLSVETASDDRGGRQREIVVAPTRVNELSGEYAASPSYVLGTTAALLFEWDNTFSWLNEKTLDYHVSVLEPLSAAKQSLRVKERSLRSVTTKISEQLALLDVEKNRREQLEKASHHFRACEDEKNELLLRSKQRKEALQHAKSQLQTQMEGLQKQLGKLVGQLDDTEIGERSVAAAWEALRSEHEDVAMTMRISANSRLEELAEILQGRKKRLEGELETVMMELGEQS